MKYDHMIKVNGKYYAAGEDVPSIEDITEDESSLPFSDKDITFETVPEEKRYTKSEIGLMKKAELQTLATEEGIEGAFEKSVEELKKILMEHFGM